MQSIPNYDLIKRIESYRSDPYINSKMNSIFYLMERQTVKINPAKKEIIFSNESEILRIQKEIESYQKIAYPELFYYPST